MDDFIVNYLLHFQISRHTTIPDVHELARDVLKAWYTYVAISLQKCKFLELNEKKALSLLISVMYVSMCVMYGSLIKIPCGACVPSKYQL